MVYIINAQDCFSGYELAKKRNILFTAMTRSKAWVRVCGFGDKMERLIQEYNNVKDARFRLKFTYPTEAERENMNIVNRDMSKDERESIEAKGKSLVALTDDLRNGKLFIQDLNPALLDELKKFLND